MQQHAFTIPEHEQVKYLKQSILQRLLFGIMDVALYLARPEAAC